MVRAMIITADSLPLRLKLDYDGGYDVDVKGPSVVVMEKGPTGTRDMQVVGSHKYT